MDAPDWVGRQARRRADLAAVLLGLTVLCFGVSQACRTAVASAASATFGKTSVGARSDRGMFANYKIVHVATLPASGSLSKLTVYAIPGINSPSPQALKAVIYSDSAGSPDALVATGSEVTYRGSTNGSGWFDLPFSAPVALAPGTYWLGFITGTTTEGMGYAYDSVANSRAYDTNTFAGGPSNPFGSSTKDSYQASIYATYSPAEATSKPVNQTPPTISGTAQQGMTLTASPGTWSNSPTSYAYKWKRCDPAGAHCAAIRGASSSTYTLGATDVNRTLRVAVSASNAIGRSAPASSAQTALVTSPQVPVNSAAPTISGTAQSGQALTANPGTWSGSPTSYAYQWQRCDPKGASCAAISGAGASTYNVAAADVGNTIRVAVIASNAAGPSAPASSAQSAVVSAATGVQRLEYVLVDGTVSVYDIDQAYKLIKTISLPQTKTGVRGVTVAPSTHMLFVSYGGDGGPNGTGSVLAYDLVSDKVTWSVNLKTGIDSGQVSPDGKRLYMPTGELDSSGIWNILDTSNGAVIGTIQGGSGAHNTVLSNDGRYVYLGGRNYNNLDVYDTSTGKVKEVGPLVNSVRPFTVNGSNTLSFTTATNFDGFQVSSITTAKVLFTVSFGAVPKGFPFTAPSHGASLSPDEKQLYVIDAVNKAVQVYDVSKVSQGVAPKQLAAIPVAGLSGTESLCAYDCGRGGWLQLSIDGRFLYVGDSGEVIDTSTLKVLTSIPTLLNTKKSLEVDWSGAVPVATSGRTGVGQVG